jgi:hypothetical protein
MAGSGSNHGVIWKYITGTDRRYCPRTDYFKLDATFNTGYRVRYPFFAQILAVCRARAITIPTIHSARHTAKIRAKSLIISNKTIPITAHLCSETAVFDHNSIRSFQRSIRYSRMKACCSIHVRNRTTAHTEYLNGLYC